jgi:hypothetical protein
MTVASKASRCATGHNPIKLVNNVCAKTTDFPFKKPLTMVLRSFCKTKPCSVWLMRTCGAESNDIMTVMILSLSKILFDFETDTRSSLRYKDQGPTLFLLRQNHPRSEAVSSAIKLAEQRLEPFSDRANSSPDSSNYTFDIPIIETPMEFNPDDPNFDPHRDN